MAEDSESGERMHSTEMERIWSLRKKEKRLYDDAVDDDEIVGKRTFNLDEKLRQALEPGQKFYVEMKGSDLTLKYFQRNGFSCPIIVKDKSGLGMRIPSTNFKVADVKRCVGSFRLLDVVDVTTQQDLVMTVKDWVRYYENTERDRLLNVISLEFSHTRLEDYVAQPEVIHHMDWVDLAWPWYHKEFQTEPTNLIEKMMYPKVQKYCLMSVKGCYTDFHIDMGGTSVWYHILKGKKIFWLIPPTEENIQLYENWTLSAKQGDIFFGDLVSNCYHISLEVGWTFFIPPGWIHAVYTPEDSLVFGGNFLHSFNIVTQLRVWEVETKTHVPPKFRYPFFIEIHWYVLERYVSCLTGKRHRVRTAEEEHLENDVGDEGVNENQSCRPETASKNSRSSDSVSQSFECNEDLGSDSNSDTERSQTSESTWVSSVKDSLAETSISAANMSQTRPWINLTPYELEGLWAIIRWLEDLPLQKRSIPKDIPTAELLLSEAKALLKLHRLDDPLKSITGSAVLQWPKGPKRKKTKKYQKSSFFHSKKSEGTGGTGQMWHYRRIRCKTCEPCTRSECGECLNCQDMKKFGGPGRKKQTCISRRCLAPLLPHNAVCQKCGQGDQPSNTSDEPRLDDLGLMECRICFDVFHPKCLKELNPELNHQGVVDEDLPNSWECSKCCEAGKEGQGKQRSIHKSTPVSLHQEHRHHSISYASPPSPVKSLLVPPAASASEAEDSDEEEEEMEVDFHMKSKTETSKSGKRKKSQRVNRDLEKQAQVWPKPQVRLEKLLENHSNCDLQLPVRPMKHRKTQPKTTFSLISPSSSSSSCSSSPILSARVNSRGREIMIPRRFLP